MCSEALDGKNDDKEDAEDDNYEEPVPVEAKSKRGQIYKLGEHRLMCGDSTREEDVQKLMDGEMADLVITDPPYNVDYTGKTKDALKIDNDKQNEESFKEFLTAAFNNMFNAMNKGAVFYIYQPQGPLNMIFKTAVFNCNQEYRQELIWNKNVMVLGHYDYHYKHEPCLYGWKDGAPHYFVEDRTQISVFEDKDFDVEKLTKEQAIDLLKQIYEYTTVFDEKKPAVNDLHPTMKPIPLINKQMKNSSRKGELVLDLFGGSGTTLITAEQIGRRCNMMEYDPRYVDVIIDRWEKLTGQTAELIDDGEGYKE